jgi:hypothetical protein
MNHVFTQAFSQVFFIEAVRSGHPMFLTIVLIAFAAFGWHFLREPEAEPVAEPAARRKSRYRAVRIVPNADACPVARAVAQRRYLFSAAPRLPLEHCDRILHCRCRFKHYADRRSGDDRRQIFGSQTEDSLRGPMNRRVRSDRRKQAPARYSYAQHH